MNMIQYLPLVMSLDIIYVAIRGERIANIPTMYSKERSHMLFVFGEFQITLKSYQWFMPGTKNGIRINIMI